MTQLRRYLYPLAVFLVYAGSLQFTGACLAYSQAMLQFSKLPYLTLRADGGLGRGKLLYVKKTSFFGQSYYLRFKDNPHHFVIPGSVSEPLPGEPPSAAVPSLSKYLEEGRELQIRTWGEGRPGWGVILGLEALGPDGKSERLLDYDISAQRYVAAIQNAPEVARRYKNVAWLPIPLALALHFLVLRRFRRRTT